MRWVNGWWSWWNEVSVRYSTLLHGPRGYFAKTDNDKSAAKEGFDALEIFFSVDAYGVVVGGFDVDVDSVLEETELFQALGLFKGAWRQCCEAVEGGFAVGVEADVLPVFRCGVGSGLSVVGAPVTVVGDGGAGEVESAAVGGGDDFDCIGVGFVLVRA